MKIKVTGWMDPDEMDPDDLDLAHLMGLSNAGYESLSSALSALGIMDAEFEVEP